METSTETTETSSCNEDKDVPEVSHKLNKLHFERLKKEDEEQWISGEELYTDGSSDEEGKKGVRRKHRREHKGARPKDKCASKNIDSIPKPALVVPEHIDSDSEELIDISWKPKRGSIKLPHMTKDLEPSPSSTSASATIAE